MIVAKLSRTGVDDRFFSLEPGEHRLGSDFNCEIALIHPEVFPEHLMLKAGEDTVFVRPKADAEVTLFRYVSQQAVILAPEEWTPWHLGDRLIISDISIEIEGVKPEAEPRPNAVQKLLENPRSRIVIAAAVLVVVTGLANLLLLSGPESAAAAHAGAAIPDEEPAATNSAGIRRQLEALGVRVQELDHEGDRWRATLRVAATADRARVQAKIAELALPLSARIHVDEEVAEAVELIVANLGGASRVLGHKDGVVTLSAVDDPKLRERLVETLKTDVPGLADVRFQRASPVDVASLAKRITGVWHGAYPYVVIDEDVIIRPGDVLGQDAKLVMIGRCHLVVEVNGRREKVLMQ